MENNCPPRRTQNLATMKRILTFLLGICLLAAPALSAADKSENKLPKKPQQFEYGLFNHLSMGLSVGLMDAVGVEFAAPVIPQLQLRAGLSFLPVKGIQLTQVSIPAWGTHAASNADIKGDFSWVNGNILVDYFPFKKSSFHVTAGIFIGGATLVKGHGYFYDPSYKNAYIEYYLDGDNHNKSITNVYQINTDENSHLAIEAKTNAVRPYLGIGFGRTVPSKRVGVSFDFGVEYTGGIKAFANGHTAADSGNSPIQITSEGVRAVVNEFKGEDSTEYVDGLGIFPSGAINYLSGFPILPVLRLTVFVRLF